MTHIKSTLIMLLTLACFLSKAQEVNHTGIITFTDNEIEDGPANTWLMTNQPQVTYYISYKLSSLYGEPTVFCQSAVILNPGNLAGSKNLKNLLKKVRVRDINFFGAFGYKSKYIIECDVGVPAKPFIGSPQEYRQLSKKQKKKYSSFNVTGSPNWESFIHKAQGFTSIASPTGIVMGFNDITVPANYVSSSKAKELYTDQNFKFKKYSHYGTGSGSFIEVDWDFSELERYYAEQKRNKTKDKIANAEEKIDKIQKRARKRAKNESGDGFRDQPDKPTTKINECKINSLEGKISSLQEQLEQEKAKVAQADKEKRKVDRYLADKREELENRPGPEDLRKLVRFKGDNGKYGYKNSKGDIVIPAQYFYSYNFIDYGYAYAAINSKKSCIINKINKKFICFNNTARSHKKQVKILLKDRFSIKKEDDFYTKVVDKNQNLIFKYPKSKCVFPGSEGLMPIISNTIRNDKYGEFDCRNNINAWIDAFGLFHKNPKNLLKFGFVDKNGVTVIPPKFNIVGKFRNGKARVGIVTDIEFNRSDDVWNTLTTIYTTRAWEINKDGKRISDYKTFRMINRVNDWFSFEE